jgi:hypothetical protein
MKRFLFIFIISNSIIKSVNCQLFSQKNHNAFFLLKNDPGASSAETSEREKKRDLESKNNNTVEVEDSDLGGVQSEM